MSVVQQNRLGFMLDFTSRRAIARQADISLYRLRQLEHTGASLTGKELNRFVNLSRRFTYRDLRIRGFSTSQATRYRGNSIDNLRLQHGRMERIQDYLTGGAFAAMKASRDRQGIAYNEDSLWIEAQESIFNGLAKSRRTIEDWENY